MGFSSDDPAGLQSEINVTPLVDVVLVLLIIFMVIAPLTLRGYDVDIPGESTVAVTADQPLEQIVLSIDATLCPILAPPDSAGLPDDCRVRLNDDTIAATALAQRVGEIFSEREVADRVLFLTAQSQLNYEGVMRVVDAAKSGVEGLRIGMVAPKSRTPIQS